jgi:hypothetical protein
MNSIAEFLRREEPLYFPDGVNGLRAACARAFWCETFLEIILDRYTTGARACGESYRRLFASGSPWVDPAAMHEFSRQKALVHLDIESYYLFSKMALDRTAQLMHWWFRPIGRGISIHRHSQVSSLSGN